jgi:hypothetical protein
MGVNISRVSRYYEYQRSDDKKPLRATIELPRALGEYVSRRRLSGDQLTGWGRFDLPLLASYSRSGTNWLRYAVEWISGRPTPGQVKIHFGTNFILDRSHNASVNMHSYSSVILSVRNYRECLLRHHPQWWEKSRSVKEFLSVDPADPEQKPRWFIENLVAFDSFDGPKLLVYFEDLQRCPSVLLTVSDFLGLDRARAERFVANVDYHYRRSVDSYVRGGHESATTESRDLSLHSRSKLAGTQAQEFDDYYRSEYPRIFATYLDRYAV